MTFLDGIRIAEHQIMVLTTVRMGAHRHGRGEGGQVPPPLEKL